MLLPGIKGLRTSPRRIKTWCPQEVAIEKKSPDALIFQLPQKKHGIIVADTEVVYDPGGFISAG